MTNKKQEELYPASGEVRNLIPKKPKRYQHSKYCVLCGSGISVAKNVQLIVCENGHEFDSSCYNNMLDAPYSVGQK